MLHSNTGDESRIIYTQQHISNLNHILKFKNLFKNCWESLNCSQRGEMTHLKYKQILEPNNRIKFLKRNLPKIAFQRTDDQPHPVCFQLGGVGLEAGCHSQVIEAEESASRKGDVDLVAHDGGSSLCQRLESTGLSRSSCSLTSLLTPAPSAHISLITHVRPDKGWLACFPIMAWMRTLPPQPACSQLLSQLPSCTSAAARLPSDYYYAASEETSIRSSESFSNLLLDSNLVLCIFPPAQEHAGKGFLDYRKDSPVWRLGGFLEHPPAPVLLRTTLLLSYSHQPAMPATRQLSEPPLSFPLLSPGSLPSLITHNQSAV